MVKLVILAAGKGTRLRPITDNIPKPLVELTDGESIMNTSISNLQSGLNFDEIVIVSGYKRECVTEFADGVNTDGVPVTVIHNPFYDEAGPVISLRSVSHKIVTDNALIINGDTIYSENIPPLLRGYDRGIFLGFSPVESASDDEMKVTTRQQESDGNSLTEVGKSLDSNYDGVTSGLMMVNGRRNRRDFIETIDKSVTKDLDMPWDHLFNMMIRAGKDVGLIEIPYAEFHEIDTVGDLQETNDLNYYNNE
jgi:choline kinase